MIGQDTAIDLFSTRFGGEPDFVIRAPGRVNLVGEHTDYNDGFVLPMAIEQATWIAVRATHDRTIRLASDEHDDAEFSLDHLVREVGPWSEYVKGVAWAMGAAHLRGWEGALASDIPIGAGLSSSAALEVASVLAFVTISDQTWDPTASALTAQRAENEWVGVSCGIMDQLIVATAEAGHATLIDCRTLGLTPAPIPDDVAVVILDTGTRRQLAESAYDERREACERAARAAGVPALRDLSVDDLDELARAVDDVTLRRARHVITENARTIEAATALGDGNVRRFGELMNDSHTSLHGDFEVSSDALDLMVEIASGIDGCIGARMTGAGFGGCAVALLRDDAAESFVTEVTRRYSAVSSNKPFAYVTKAAAGARIEQIGDRIG